MSNYCFTLLRLDWFYYLPVYVSSTVSTFIQRERNVAIANTEKFNGKRMKSIGKKGKKEQIPLAVTHNLFFIRNRQTTIVSNESLFRVYYRRTLAGFPPYRIKS